METRVEGEHKYYSPSKVEDKHFFGGFFNLAWNNIEGVMDEFKKRFLPLKRDVDALDSEDKKRKLSSHYKFLFTYFTDDISIPDWEHRITFLSNYFPVVKFLDRPITDTLFSNETDKQKAKRTYFRNAFGDLLNLVSNLRNVYTHYAHLPIETIRDAENKDIYKFIVNTGREITKENLYCFDLLDKCLLSVVCHVKRTKKRSDKTRQLLKSKIKDEMPILRQLKEKELITKSEKDKRIKIPTDSKEKEEFLDKCIFNDAFKHLIYQDEENNLQVSGWYKSKLKEGEECDNNVLLSPAGVLFLLSMFLTRKENMDMHAKVIGFKSTKVAKEDLSAKKNSLKMMATHWVFCHLSFKGLKRRLRTTLNAEDPLKEKLRNTYTKDALLAQIADELSKVPDEVYRNLSLEKQELFLEDINEYIKEGKEDLTLNDSVVIHPVIRKRYEDKFNYFVIRYLDEVVGFPSLRFQINLGCYVHNVKEKQIEGTKLYTERSVREQLRVFGKLSDIANIKSNYFDYLSMESESDSELDEDTIQITDCKDNIWEMHPNPSYNFSKNNIPIYIDFSSSNVEGAKEVGEEHLLSQQFLEKKERSKSKESKKSIINKLLLGKESDAINADARPSALLSLNELPALLYEVLVKGKSGKEIEEIIIQKIVEQQKHIESYTTDNESLKSVVPKKMTKSSHKEELYVSQLLKAINLEISRTEEKQNLIQNKERDLIEQNKDNPRNRKTSPFKTYELGQEATWLANDIKRFMPVKARSKWRSRHHVNLQEMLAYYDVKRREIMTFLSLFWNLNSSDWDKGFKESLNKESFVAFYKAYLDNRKRTLSTFIKFVNTYYDLYKDDMASLNKGLKEVFVVFDRHLYVLQSTEEQKKRLNRALFVLPRGIFDSKPTFIENLTYKDNPQAFADWYQYANNPEIEFQSFYDLPRDYTDYFNEQQEERRKRYLRKEEIHRKEKDIEEVKRIYSQQEDMIIKKVMHKDVYLQLIFLDLFKNLYGTKLTISLKDMYQTREERKKNLYEANKQCSREDGDNSENIYNNNFVWNLTVDYQSSYPQITKEKVKIKDIGKRRRFETDKKVGFLLSYNSSKVWTKRELEDELELQPLSYEVIRREHIFKEFQRLEKYLYEDVYKFNVGNELSMTPPNFGKWITIGVLLRFNLCQKFPIFKDFKGGSKGLSDPTNMIKKVYLLSNLRNAFAHNNLLSLPNFNFMNECYPNNNSQTYSAYFLEVTRTIVDEIIALK